MWFWDGHEHVDPSKEATAQEKRLANNTTTLAAEYAKQGKDHMGTVPTAHSGTVPTARR